ncbi:hypothetical protein NLG97_g10820 [Lecanicillium saksenae]|uniref:Uncharacterized protein n=1 Tax=Lecanicillium saksenae TaxID=468837 RepID=A0ACC1QF30_9HYPO|nr:hypothetical protein NLG97_g10820 [Lecanicillium saksenae]
MARLRRRESCPTPATTLPEHVHKDTYSAPATPAEVGGRAPLPISTWTAEWLAALLPTESAGDESFGDDAFGVDSVLQSVTSSAYAHTYECGRRYPSFNDNRYPIPNDDLEQSREDLQHSMLMELMDGELFFSPIGTYPQQIVDIGTGTGKYFQSIQSWHFKLIIIGDAYPSASVLGVDLSPIQPSWVPPNVEFIIDDCERDWLIDKVDLAHFRFMAMILPNTPLVMKRAFQALRPGGWIEFQELHCIPFCDNQTMDADDPFKVLYELAGQAYSKLGLSMSLPAELEPMLLATGFENIHRRVIKVPIGSWAEEETLRLVGMYQKRVIIDFISTFAGRPFQALGISEQEAQVRLALARQALEEPHVHRYFNYHFWYAQKPVDAVETGDTGD